MPVELDDVGADGSGSHSAHLCNLSIRQYISIEAVNGSISVADQAEYLVRAERRSHYPGYCMSHLGYLKIYMIRILKY